MIYFVLYKYIFYIKNHIYKNIYPLLKKKSERKEDKERKGREKENSSILIV